MVREDADGPDLGRRSGDGKDGEREALAAMDPDKFYWTPHHDRSPNLILIRLDKIDVDEVTELLQESYRIAGATKN